ncbi:MAG: putative esterase [Rhodothermales bacterium]|jgi:predicted esterase
MRSEPTERTVEVPRTARYFVRGDAEGASEVWVLLHGYGQLARDFLDSCQALARPGRLLVAPEGLSRFYVKGFFEAPGASWMTSEARLGEVRDYVRYLDAVMEDLGGPDNVSILGFSQGAATASRWAALGRVKPTRLICWAGDVAHDIPLDALASVPVTMVLGEKDKLLTKAHRVEALARLDATDVAYRVERFDGGHRLDDETLRRISAAD